VPNRSQEVNRFMDELGHPLKEGGRAPEDGHPKLERWDHGACEMERTELPLRG
jgi:hypothetical protein